VSPAKRSQRRLHMRYSGGLVKHLGLQMYTGAVSAIAELVANSWDADAANVWIDIPLDVPLEADSLITVRDDGRGMSFDDIEDRYLPVGLGRRAKHGDRTSDGRPVMGRKGIGKLAGFGIAHRIELWTVDAHRHVTAFELSYDKIVKDDALAVIETYEPPILADRQLKAADPINKGTQVELHDIQIRNAINSDRFRAGLTRRFAVLSDKFRVHVNGKRIKRSQIPFEFRFPESGTTIDNVPGLGQIRWWAGFTASPIEIEEQRGFVVLARGKLAQAPFFFDTSGGMHGQFGMQYMTGEVIADGLDEERDLIATDRASIRWDDPLAAPLHTWGQAKVREVMARWAGLREAKNLKRVRSTSQYTERIAKFPERERAELTIAISKLAAIETIDDKRLDELVEILLKAYENEHFMQLIRALKETDEAAHVEIYKLMQEWDVLEAIQVAQLVRGRVEVIHTFRRLIEAGTREKPEMQDYLKKYPWLIEPGWEMLRHEAGLDRVLLAKFHSKTKDEHRRIDFFCLADSLRSVVVEAKRPGETIAEKELGQLKGYVDFLRDRRTNTTDPGHAREVEGRLIYSKAARGTTPEILRMRTDRMYVVTWDELLETAERLHREFLDVVKARAPKDDPRIKALPKLSGKSAN
jgi:RecB family endonuclease NucS